MDNHINLIEIKNRAGAAAAVDGPGAQMEPLEGLEGWGIAVTTFEEVGIDRVILTCDANAAVNPLHSGGDCHWLGYLEEGPVELILGDSEGKQTSSRIVNPGEYMTFAPETQHGWVPQGTEAKIVFIKLK